MGKGMQKDYWGIRSSKGLSSIQNSFGFMYLCACSIGHLKWCFLCVCFFLDSFDKIKVYFPLLILEKSILQETLSLPVDKRVSLTTWTPRNQMFCRKSLLLASQKIVSTILETYLQFLWKIIIWGEVGCPEILIVNILTLNLQSLLSHSRANTYIYLSAWLWCMRKPFNWNILKLWNIYCSTFTTILWK